MDEESEAVRDIHVDISSDGLLATVTIEPGPAGARQTLSNALDKAGVQVGIHKVTMNEFSRQLADPKFAIEEHAIAAGKKATPGREAYLELYFESARITAGTIHDNKFDFRDRGILKPIMAGHKVARYHARREPQDGVTVRGDIVVGEAAPPDEKMIALGDGVKLRANGTIIAASGGIIVYKPGDTVDVQVEYEHVGDVNLACGNLESHGCLRVRGNIVRNFMVSGSKGVEITGGVNSGSVYSRGQLLISGGVRGSGISIVSTTDDCKIHHTEGALVECGGSLHLEGDSVNSRLHGEHVKIAGRVLGGTVRAEKSLCVGNAGSTKSIETLLSTADPLEHPLESEDKAFTLAGARKLAYERRGDTDIKRRLGKEEREALRNERAANRADKRARSQTLLKDARIDILGTAHPGVTIKIGDATVWLEEQAMCVRFTYNLETRLLERNSLIALGIVKVDGDKSS